MKISLLIGSLIISQLTIFSHSQQKTSNQRIPVSENQQQPVYDQTIDPKAQKGLENLQNHINHSQTNQVNQNNQDQDTAPYAQTHPKATQHVQNNQNHQNKIQKVQHALEDPFNGVEITQEQLEKKRAQKPMLKFLGFAILDKSSQQAIKVDSFLKQKGQQINISLRDLQIKKIKVQRTAGVRYKVEYQNDDYSFTGSVMQNHDGTKLELIYLQDFRKNNQKDQQNSETIFQNQQN